MKDMDQLETRAVKAEQDLRISTSELEKVTGQSTSLAAERDSLREQLDALKVKVGRRNDQLKATHKSLRKEVKKLQHTEDKVFQMGFDYAVWKAASSSLNHTFLLDEGASDSVGRVDVDEPLVVSSVEDEDLVSD